MANCQCQMFWLRYKIKIPFFWRKSDECGTRKRKDLATAVKIPPPSQKQIGDALLIELPQDSFASCPDSFLPAVFPTE